jgi:hypothetical protein
VGEGDRYEGLSQGEPTLMKIDLSFLISKQVLLDGAFMGVGSHGLRVRI